MIKNRRRTLNVDKIFQKRLLFIFLGWNLVVVLAYFAFYIVHLKNLIEENLYRAHIQISNLTEVFSGEFIQFSLILAGISMVALLIFYLSVRLRIKSFFNGIKTALQSRMGGRLENRSLVPTSEEFAGIDLVLQDFFRDVDEEIEQGQKRLSLLKKSINTHKQGQI